jgi:hypothetical protein
VLLERPQWGKRGTSHVLSQEGEVAYRITTCWIPRIDAIRGVRWG